MAIPASVNTNRITGKRNIKKKIITLKRCIYSVKNEGTKRSAAESAQQNSPYHTKCMLKVETGMASKY